MISPDKQFNNINRKDISIKVYSALTATLMALSLQLGTPKVTFALNEPPPPTSSITDLTGNCPGNWKKGEAKKGDTSFKQYCYGGNGDIYVYTEGQSNPIVVVDGNVYNAVFTDKPHKEQKLVEGVNFRMICDGPKDPGVCKGGQIIIMNSVIKKLEKPKQVVIPEDTYKKQVTYGDLDNIQIIGLFGGMGLIIVLKLILSGRNNILGVKNNVVRGVGKIKNTVNVKRR